MRPLNFVARNPLPLLAGAAAAFLAWVVLDAVGPRPKTNPPPLPAEAPLPSEELLMRAVGVAIHALQPGTPRADVEQQIGGPAPRDVRPIERANGRVVYRTVYPVYLSVPLRSSPGVAGHCDAVLEYDAAIPGHPLVRITAQPRALPPPPAFVPTTA